MRNWLPFLSIGLLGYISVFTLSAIGNDLWQKQVAFIAFSLFIMWLAASVPFSSWLSHRWWTYGLTIFLLLVPFLLHQSSRNTARWIDFGLLSLQPSQLALPFLALVVVIIASLPLSEWQRIGRIALALCAPLGIIFLSPDLGTTVLLIVSLGSVFWFGKFSLRSIFLMLGGSMLLLAFGWLVLLKPYQKERFTLFLQGNSRQVNVHYNALQSHIAVGSGGLFGQGYASGTQVSLAFLPESHTDFWFASFAEQSGFIGVCLILSIYSILCANFIHFALHESREPNRLFILIGVVGLSIQIFVNIGMNIGLLPITGVTLPFLSYGGSSFLASCLLVGMMLSATRRSARFPLTWPWYNFPSVLQK